MTPWPRFAMTFAITSLAWFLFALDRLVVTTALPVIRTELGARVEDLEWTVNAYTLTFAVLLLTGAALGDRFGRRRMLAVGVAVFTAGSAAAALAPTIGVLVVARAVQGVGGALFLPLTLTILSAATPPARRGAALGAWGGIGALGGALGPLLGGALASGPGWQWIFWLNVPLGLVLIPVALRGLPESHGPHGRLDGPGVVLGSAGLFGLVWGVVGGNAAGWASPQIVLALSGGALGLITFVVWERRTASPMLPMHFFANRTFAAATLASLLMYSAMFGALFLLTQLLQTGLGATPLQAGLQTLPMVGVPLVLAPAGGILCDRLGTRPLMISGVALEAVAFAWLAAVARPEVPYTLLVPGFVMIGAGAAVFFAPVAAATLGAVRPQEQGQASGAATAVRELAVVFGVALLASVFRRIWRLRLGRGVRRRVCPRAVGGRGPGSRRGARRLARHGADPGCSDCAAPDARARGSRCGVRAGKGTALGAAVSLSRRHSLPRWTRWRQETNSPRAESPACSLSSSLASLAPSGSTRRSVLRLGWRRGCSSPPAMIGSSERTWPTPPRSPHGSSRPPAIHPRPARLARSGTRCSSPSSTSAAAPAHTPWVARLSGGVSPTRRAAWCAHISGHSVLRVAATLPGRGSRTG
jgi:EmrB/QacA subfamily drug resistance transporter